jgi:hypothetical protein
LVIGGGGGGGGGVGQENGGVFIYGSRGIG